MQGQKEIVVLSTRDTDFGEDLDAEGYLAPNEQAIKRVAKAADRIYGTDTQICFIGGSPDFRGVTRAQHMVHYFKKKYPTLVSQVLIVSGGAEDPVDEMVGLTNELRKIKIFTATLVLVNRLTGCLELCPTVYRLGYDFKICSSGEQTTLEEALTDLTRSGLNIFDPFHETSAGENLREMASKNATEYRHRTERYQLAHTFSLLG